MKVIFSIFITFFSMFSFGQREYHVFPADHKTNPGKPSGNGSLQSPWDLQTAFIQKNNSVDGGDTIWLHEGIYNGRYISKLSSSHENQFVTVSAFKNERVVINGNVQAKPKHVLQVTGPRVIYRDFEVTFLGNVLRNEKNPEMQILGGITHTGGVNCKFINLKIYNLPGLGFGSWNTTGGTIIEYCMIFNNGIFFKNGKGGGEGMYVQNSSDKETRIIRNNIIFGNYYKAIEVWSANRDANREYVKNITIENNIIFNSGLPAGQTVDNIIIASDDRNGINVAKNIKVIDNILYHNTDFVKNEVNGDAPSLTLGYYKKSPVENITIDNNVIIGRNNALRLLHIKSALFTKNTVYGGYIQANNNILENLKGTNWKFKNNTFYTKNRTPFYNLESKKKYRPEIWNKELGVSEYNDFKSINQFNLNSVLDITQNEYRPNEYRVTLFDKLGNDVLVDFSDYEVPVGTIYSIRDVESYDKVIKSGYLGDDKSIEFPMKLNNGNTNKTLNNFGVYIIEFSELEKEKENFFKRIFGWLF